jgi:hypothetical protein
MLIKFRFHIFGERERESRYAIWFVIMLYILSFLTALTTRPFYSLRDSLKQIRI